MSKHVFEVTDYGQCRNLGEYVKETEKTYTVRYKGWRGDLLENRRGKTSGMRVIETDDPDAITKAFAEEWAKHYATVNAAREALRRAAHEQLSASIKAAFPTESPSEPAGHGEAI